MCVVLFLVQQWRRSFRLLSPAAGLYCRGSITAVSLLQFQKEIYNQHYHMLSKQTITKTAIAQVTANVTYYGFWTFCWSDPTRHLKTFPLFSGILWWEVFNRVTVGMLKQSLWQSLLDVSWMVMQLAASHHINNVTFTKTKADLLWNPLIKDVCQLFLFRKHKFKKSNWRV